MFKICFFFRNNVEKYGRARQATEEYNTVRAICVLDNYRLKTHTHKLIAFPR